MKVFDNARVCISVHVHARKREGEGQGEGKERELYGFSSHDFTCPFRTDKGILDDLRTVSQSITEENIITEPMKLQVREKVKEWFVLYQEEYASTAVIILA